MMKPEVKFSARYNDNPDPAERAAVDRSFAIVSAMVDGLEKERDRPDFPDTAVVFGQSFAQALAGGLVRGFGPYGAVEVVMVLDAMTRAIQATFVAAKEASEAGEPMTPEEQGAMQADFFRKAMTLHATIAKASAAIREQLDDGASPEEVSQTLGEFCDSVKEIDDGPTKH